MNQPWRILIAVTLLTGCSAEHYRDSADLQVGKLLDDRQKQTLEYTPQVEVAKEIPKTTAKSYEKIPASPVPPPNKAPIEAQHAVIPYQPLGPELSLLNPQPDAVEASGVQLLARARQQPVLGPPTPESLQRRFELFDCIAYAVQHSRGYQDQMEGLYITALDVTLQRHLFEPRPFITTGVDYTGGQKDVDYRSAWTVTNAVGVRQQLPYGGQLTATALVDFVNTINGNVNDGESATLALTGSMPLLRGFGMVNLEPLINSERQLIYAVRAFEDFRRSFVVDIARSYFNLIQNQQRITNLRLNLISYVELTNQTQALYDANRVISLEVQRALQSQLQAQSDLIVAEEGYQSALDDFKLVLGMPVDEQLDVAAVELEVTVPRISADDAVNIAHQYRLSLKTAEDQLEDARRNVKNAQNGLLPDLNLRAQGQVGNEAESPAVQLRDRTATYSAGVTLDLPVDRVAERNSFRRSLISFQHAERNYEATRDRITADVRDTLRAIRAAELSLDIQRRGIELAQRRVEYATARLLLGGNLSSRDVVEAQTSLLSAQDSYEQAKSVLQIRVLEYMRDTGTLRVDPKAGSIGRAMDRKPSQPTNGPRSDS